MFNHIARSMLPLCVFPSLTTLDFKGNPCTVIQLNLAVDLEVTVTNFLQFYINGEIGYETGSIEKIFSGK